MSRSLVLLVALSCSLSFAAAIYVFSAGFGLLLAFLVYALGGSMMVIAFTAMAFVPEALARSRTRASLTEERVDQAIDARLVSFG